MKQIQISTSEVARVAAKNIVINGSDTITAVAKSAELQALKSRLLRGEICKWAYKKVNGEIRICVGILYNDMVKNMTVGGHTPKSISDSSHTSKFLQMVTWSGEVFVNPISSAQ